MTFWGLADYQVDEIIEVFADREDAEQMLRDCLSDEPEWTERIRSGHSRPCAILDYGAVRARGADRVPRCSRAHR